jgi:hypothetical protein
LVTRHRGHTIDVRRGECLGGWQRLFFTVIRDEDGYICVEDGENSDERVRDKVKQMRRRIDAELLSDDPWDERLEWER